MSVIEFAKAHMDETAEQATWFALGYASASGMGITADEAKEFGQHYAAKYVAWFEAGNPSSAYPVHGAVMREWLR